MSRATARNTEHHESSKIGPNPDGRFGPGRAQDNALQQSVEAVNELPNLRAQQLFRQGAGADQTISGEEAEADRIARVVRLQSRPGAANSSAGALNLQHPGKHSTTQFPFQTSGHELPPGVRDSYERELGADFSGVRIHREGPASRLASMMQANAFTYGNQLAFAPGQYAPDSTDGKLLLAHELTHVLQQQRSGQPRLRRDGGPNGGATETPAGDLSNSALIAELLEVRTWLQSHTDESEERTEKLARRDALVREKNARIASGHAWLARTDDQTPAQLYQLVPTPNGTLVVEVTDSNVREQAGGFNLQGTRVVTRDQLPEMETTSTGGGSGSTPPVGPAAANYDPVAASIDTAFSGRQSTPYSQGARRAGTVRVIAPNGQPILAPYSIQHPATVPEAFGGAIMEMGLSTAGQVNYPEIANWIEAGQAERARGPNAGEVSLRNMGAWAADAPEVRVMLVRSGNEILFVGYDTSQYSQRIITGGYVESQTGSGGVGQALLADRIQRALGRGVPDMLVEVGLSEGTERFHQRIHDATGSGETASTGDRYTLNTRRMVQVLLDFSDRIPQAQRSRLQALVANGNNPTPAEVRAVIADIPEPRIVPVPGGGGYLRAMGYGGGLGAALPTVIEGGQLLWSGQTLTAEHGVHLGQTAGLGFGSGMAGAALEQGVLNRLALNPAMSRWQIAGGRGIGGGMAGGIAAPMFVMGQMALSDQQHSTEDYVARGGRASGVGVLSGALSAGLVGAIWGTEVPILGNIVGFVVGFVGYLAIDALVGEEMEEAIRQGWREMEREAGEMAEAAEWAARESPGSFIPAGMVTPLSLRGGYGGLLRSPLDVMREPRR